MLTVDERARVHAALGDPARLAIVDDLVASDRSPTELSARFSIPTNLLAHHLDVLEHGGLIERFDSSGDRRRRYVRLIHDALAGFDLNTARNVRRPLFVCRRNTARSQLAAALWTARTGHPASSAGTRPADRVHPLAIAAAARAGLDLRDATPRPIDRRRRPDVVVTVCDQAHEGLDLQAEWWHWSMPDPVPTDDPAAFDLVVERLDARIAAVIPSATTRRRGRTP